MYNDDTYNIEDIMQNQIDTLRGKILLTSTQIDFHMDEIRRHFGALAWINTNMICDFLEMPQNQSTSTMIGVAMRRDPRVNCKRTTKGRIFVFTE